MPLAVMLRSAIGNLAPASRIRAHVAADDLSADTRRRVEDSLPPTVTVHWVDRSAREFARFPLWGRMPLSTYHKLTLGSWLPSHIGKAIWLDCDTLILDDLTRLWNTPLRGATVAACQDRLVTTLGSQFGVAGWRDLSLAPAAAYFNAGVMLVDIHRWRGTDVESRSVEYLHRFGPRVWFWDQEALNAALAGHWHSLEARWNRGPASTSASDPESTGDAPRGIVHFSGGLKPWRIASRGRDSAAWERWLDRTAWAGTRPTRSAIDRIVDCYARSSIRSWLLPIETLHMRWVRWSTQHVTRSMEPRR